MVRKVGHVVQVEILGTDDQGRTLVRCPARGCGEPAHVEADGRVVCPVAEAGAEFLRAAMARLDTSWLIGS